MGMERNRNNCERAGRQYGCSLCGKRIGLQIHVIVGTHKVGGISPRSGTGYADLARRCDVTG